MKFDPEAFVSYAHLDDQPWRGRKWVTDFSGHLKTRLDMWLGEEVEIWRDPKLAGDDSFEDAILLKLRRSGVLVSVLSPRYLKSEWTMRELQEFCKAANETGGLKIGYKVRLIKIEKMPVPLDSQTPEMKRVNGFKFFEEDRTTGEIRELDGSKDAYWYKVDDVAKNMSELLELLDEKLKTALSPPPGPKKTVYLAETTPDLELERDSLKRDLEDLGHTVLPRQPIPTGTGERTDFIRKELDRCDLSVHLVGGRHSLAVELQDKIGIERAGKGDFARLVWIPQGLEIKDKRQRGFVEALRLDSHVPHGTDLLETSFEALKTEIHNCLKTAEGSRPKQDKVVTPAQALGQIYFIHDEHDQEAIHPWTDFLNERGFEVDPSVFGDDASERRACHKASLCAADALLIFHGAGSDTWLKQKMQDLDKLPAYGRTKPAPPVGVCLAPPATLAKRNFVTHKYYVIRQPEGFAPEAFVPFLDPLKSALNEP